MLKTLRYFTNIILLGLVTTPVSVMAADVNPITIGLDADMSVGASPP